MQKCLSPESCNEKERNELHGEGHEYIIYRNLNNGIQKWIDVTGKNKEEIQETWDTILDGDGMAEPQPGKPGQDVKVFRASS